MIALGTLAVCLLLGRSVLAQTNKGFDDPIQYEFDDDDLLGDAFLSDGDLITLRVGPSRTLLLRPRISFVPEMMKSVEHL